MSKNKDLNREEIRVFNEIKKEAIEEAKKPIPKNGKTYGIAALIISIIGLPFLLLVPVIAIFLGISGILLAQAAIKRGSKKLGKVAGMIGFIDILLFLVEVVWIIAGFTI